MGSSFYEIWVSNSVVITDFGLIVEIEMNVDERAEENFIGKLNAADVPGGRAPAALGSGPHAQRPRGRCCRS